MEEGGYGSFEKGQGIGVRANKDTPRQVPLAVPRFMAGSRVKFRHDDGRTIVGEVQWNMIRAQQSVIVADDGFEYTVDQDQLSQAG